MEKLKPWIRKFKRKLIMISFNYKINDNKLIFYISTNKIKI